MCIIVINLPDRNLHIETLISLLESVNVKMAQLKKKINIFNLISN